MSRYPVAAVVFMLIAPYVGAHPPDDPNSPEYNNLVQSPVLRQNLNKPEVRRGVEGAIRWVPKRLTTSDTGPRLDRPLGGAKPGQNATHPLSPAEFARRSVIRNEEDVAVMQRGILNHTRSLYGARADHDRLQRSGNASATMLGQQGMTIDVNLKGLEYWAAQRQKADNAARNGEFEKAAVLLQDIRTPR